MRFKSYDMRRCYGGPCWCCRRRDDGGYLDGSKWSARVVWTCERHSRKLYDMATKITLPEFDRIEQEAIRAAGDQAGAYLDSIGRTDLAQLDEIEWLMFCKTMIVAFGNSIEAHLQEVPF